MSSGRWLDNWVGYQIINVKNIKIMKSCLQNSLSAMQGSHYFKDSGCISCTATGHGWDKGVTVQKYASKSYNPFLHNYFQPPKRRTNKESNPTSAEKTKWTADKRGIACPWSACPQMLRGAQGEPALHKHPWDHKAPAGHERKCHIHCISIHHR